eukprot:Phypoly_transcript_15783.p1 GENE.Phypoly_transcript_15783~~Phypoly_transcript_15783.p1  ORF type:complete len:192 (+),score=5.00 Phypoly_transcript_15783:80-655(+)
MGSPMHLSRNYIAKAHLNHGSKSWREAKLTSDKFEEKFSSWYSCEITTKETDTFGENSEKSVVVYNVQVSVHLNDSAPIVYVVRRRFKEWLALHEELLERIPSLSDKAPPGFPSRTLTKPSVEVVHARAGYFHKYLNVLNHDPQLANASSLLSFLELNSVVQCLSVVCIYFISYCMTLKSIFRHVIITNEF